MPGHVNSEKKTHNDTCRTAEGVAQSAIAAATTQATATAANVTYNRAAVTSGLVNGVDTSNFIHALWLNGTGGY